MKAAAFLILGALPLAAQDIAPKDSERDPVLTALLEETTEVAPDSLAADLEPPVLVTGNPPDEAELLDPDHTAEPTADEPEPPADEPSAARGVNVEVVGGNNAQRIDAAEVKLLAPFPAKPLSEPPAGWKIVQPEGAPAFSETVELANGTRLDLSIRPHLLVPDADGSQVFALSEPGFDAALGYAQTDTVGSVLADSIRELDRNGERLDKAARRLSELLDSLPAPQVDQEQPEQEEP